MEGTALSKGATAWPDVPLSLKFWLSPPAVLRGPAECLLMFPFAFGCRLESVFSFSGWCHLPPHPNPFLLALLFAVVEKFPDFLSCLKSEVLI